MEPEDQLALLRRFEPAVHYTRGELFLPMAVEDYVSASALVEGVGDKRRTSIDRGYLTLDGLCDFARSKPSARLSLEHVGEPLDRAQFRAWRKRPGREPFRASSRFAVVGLMSRLVDSVLRLTLLLRGRVPGRFTAAAQQAYEATPGFDRCVYYGRVVEDGGYVVCQYWYFYAMNDWRSTFGGVNDHEGDWEQVTMFLVEEQGEFKPAWVAFSSHDEVGDDLRRRVDDPDITYIDGHPVVYSGAGSHSGAYLPGEYVVSTPIPLHGWVGKLRALWTRVRPWARDEDQSMLSVPYIDYRRGDGHRVGIGGDRQWHPVLIDDQTPWVREYKGLWGLDTSDPLGGERAPAGPRYERDGTVRDSWFQPVAWAGLDKEASTPAEARSKMEASRARLVAELEQVDANLEIERDRLRGARAAEQALGRTGRRPMRVRAELQTNVTQLRERKRELSSLIEGVDTALRAGTPPDPVHAHLSHRALPIDEVTMPRGRLLRLWTAASTALLLGALGILLITDGTSSIGILEIAGVMLVIEAVLRRRLIALIAGLVVIATAVAGVWAVFSLLVGNIADALGVALILWAIYLAISTIKEGLSTR
jgi:hypothetical protein